VKSVAAFVFFHAHGCATKAYERLFLEPKIGQPLLAGTMPPSRMKEVDEALRLVLGLASDDGV